MVTINDGPSDEEVSATSNSLIQKDDDPISLPLRPPPGGKKKKASRHEGKIIEIRPPKPTSTYESFPNARGQRSASHSRDSRTSRNNSARSPTKQQIGKARRVLTQYHHPGESIHEDTAKYQQPRQQQRYPSPPHVKQPKVAGMHSRMIDEVRESSLDVDESASARQLRRRMLRMTLERNVSMDEKRRKMGDHRSEASSSVTKTAAAKSSIPSLKSPPPPPTVAPSYRTIVVHLITQNEPDKLSQIDRVMQKYSGREEELITKLDLRYRKKKRRGGGEGSSRSEGGQISMESGNEADGGGGSKVHEVVSRDSVGNEVIADTDAVPATSLKESPKKDRSAIQMMQSWDRKHSEVEDAPIDVKNVESKTATIPRVDEAEVRDASIDVNNDVNNVETITATIPKSDQVGVIKPDLKVSTRTDSTRTELHSNTEKDDDIDEGRLPKVPETTTMRLTSTPTRTIDKSSTQNSPAFNDDISLITMETKETLFRNKGEAVYSFAEMMRRPPASIIVDGGSGSEQRGGLDESGQSTQQQQKQLVPPKIQRMLPQYDESEKAKAAEISSEAAAKLDNVEARILARRKLREEEALLSERDELPISAGRDEMKSKEVSSTMAFDEEESFIGKSKTATPSEVPSEILENSFSLIDSEAKQPTSSNNGDAEVEPGECLALEEEKLDITLLRDNTKSSLDRHGESDIDISMDGPDTSDAINEEIDTKNPDVKSKSITAPMAEEDIPLDELNASIQQSNAAEANEKPLDVTNETDQSYITCIQSPEVATKSLKTASGPIDMPDDEIGNIAKSQDQKRENEAAIASTSQDTEIKLKAMEDEIARLIAEKESRFAAEKAVAFKMAEQALEEERRARLEAEEARLKAEKELERLKAEAEVRLKASESSKEPNISDSDVTIKPNLVNESEEIKPQPLTPEDEAAPIIESAKERSLPVNEDSKEAVSHDLDRGTMPIESETDSMLVSVNSMDVETKQELMSMIAEMEEQVTAFTSVHPSDAKPEEPLNTTQNDDDSVDIVEKMRSVWASDDEESSHHHRYAATSEDDSDYEEEINQSAMEAGDDDNDSDHSDEQSYLPGSLQSSPERNTTTIPLPENFPSMTISQGPLETSLAQDSAPHISAAGMPMLSNKDHDIPSMYMPHRQTSAAQILDTDESQTLATKPDLPKKPSIFDDDEGEANIHHVAKITFDGNPAKGQLSFTSGSEVLAHSNQRGEWWLGRCGGRTGWFPASAVVPASEYLQSLGPALGEFNVEDEGDEDADMKFPQLSQEELHATYDLIRSPSGEDESPKRAGTKPDSSEVVDLAEEPSEPFVNDQSNVISAYDSMLDEYDSMLSPSSANEKTVQEEEPSIDASTQVEQPKLGTTASGEKKPKRLWRSAHDPNSGLTYYYNYKTRETTWEKPDDFVERPSPTKPQPTADTLKANEGDVGIKETGPKEHVRSGSRRFLGLFSKPLSKKNHEPGSKSTTPSSPVCNDMSQNEKQIDNVKEFSENKATNELIDNLNNTWEVDDVSSVSSEGTSNSIFSAKKVKKALGKVGSKIVGKINISPTNNSSYGALNDSFSQQKAAQDDKSQVADNAKQMQSSVNEGGGTTTQTETSKSNSNEANSSSERKKKDTRWRSAIDPLTGRTYYFNKDSKETVWEKPENF